MDDDRLYVASIISFPLWKNDVLSGLFQEAGIVDMNLFLDDCDQLSLLFLEIGL